MSVEVKYTFEVSIPQLEPLGDRLMAGLGVLADAIQRVSDKVDGAAEKLSAELLQIAEAMRDNPTEEEVAALADRVDEVGHKVEAMGEDIANIIPDAPPEP